MSIKEYARHELELLGDYGIQKLMNQNILEVIDVITKQGHTGSSFNYMFSMLERVIKGKPVTALTGEEDEWGEWYQCGSRKIRDNIRCSSVYQEESGKSYDGEAYCCTDNGGITFFSSGRFIKEITFPYYPPTKPEVVYIEYTEEVPLGYGSDNYEIITGDKERIKALYEKSKKRFEEVE